MTVALSVNLNKIALLRNSREGDYPSVFEYAQKCIDVGVDGITVHPRPDQRHIRPSDVRVLSQLIEPLINVEFNVEGNPFADACGDYPGFIELVKDCRPDQCTLVPDSDEQLTSDHGFDLKVSGKTLKPIIAELKSLGIRVSLFMDPDLEQIKLAQEVGTDRIELYTGPYAESFKQGQQEHWLPQWQAHNNAAKLAAELGLGVNAGHDLNRLNLPKYAEIGQLQEVSIGHALTVDALNMGFTDAVAAYLKICQGKA